MKLFTLATRMHLKTLLISTVVSAGLIQNAHAASTMVTDAVGTQELWSFQEVLGAQKLISKINQVDGKGVTQTWDANGNKLTRTDAEGRITSYTYNATNQRTSMTEAFGTAEARVTTYEYVSADIDLVTKTSSPSIFGANIKDVITAYDTNQNVTSVTINGFDALGGAVTRATTFQHDVYGKVTQINGPRTDVNDITTLEYYDCNTGAECGQLQKVTNAAGHETTYDSYDGAARLLQMTNANGVVTTNTYHPRGWLLTTTQTPPAGSARITTYEYDAVGQMTKVTLPDGTEQNYVYDAAHDLREIFDNLGNKVEYTYDSKGNRTDELVKDPDGALVRSTITSYDIRNFIEEVNTAGSVTQLVNDAVGNLSTQTDPNVNPSTSHTFDALDRLTDTVDALTNNSGYQYNVADQLIQVTAPNGVVTQYEYDDLGNQTKEISADRGTITYTHDDAGNVTSMTDARSITTNYTYDVLNRLTNVTYPTASENITYTYDVGCVFGIGRLCQVQDDSGLDTYEYEAWGNVTQCTKEEHDDSGTPIATFVTSYQYDDANRVTQVTYPSGRTVSTTRDAIGRLSGMTSDLNGELSTIIASRVYRADGYWTEQSYGNGLIQSKTYDQQGRLTDHVAGDYSRQYVYDPNGNITSADSQNNSVDRDYDYDVLDRLTQDADPIDAMIRDFGYDANGNRESETVNGQLTDLNYLPSSNQLSSVGGTPLVIDVSGRTQNDQAGRVYTYNDAGRIKTISMGGSVVGEYTYNNQQLRTQKVANGVTTIYHYDLAGNLIGESDDAGSTLQEYVYADGERVATFAVPAPGSSIDPADLAVAFDLSAHVAYGGNAYGVDGFDHPSSGSVDLAANGKQITLNGIRMRAVPISYQITPNTVLSFDFSSTMEGQVQGILLDDDLNLNLERLFKLFGTLPYGLSDFDNYMLSDGTKRYTIPIGEYYQGTANYIGFAMYNTADSASNATFSNVKLYEQSVDDNVGDSEVVIDLSSTESYGSGNNSGVAEIMSDGGLRLSGDIWRKVAQSVSITPETELHFEFRSNAQGEVHGIGFDINNTLSPFFDRGRFFQVWGSDTFGEGVANGYTGNGAYQTYQIPVGQFVIGTFPYVTFAMDDDANNSGESVFRNVRLIEPEPSEPPQQLSLFYYINDHLMTPQKLVNQTNETTWEATYEAFGAVDISTEVVTNNHRFPGQYFDAESGLYYNWNRYYDPTTGRYVTSDPIGLWGGLNTFGYVGGNPLIRFDPYGLYGTANVIYDSKNPMDRHIRDRNGGKRCVTPECAAGLDIRSPREAMGEACYDCTVSCVQNFFFGTEGPLFGEAYTSAAQGGLNSAANRSSSRAIRKGVQAIGGKFFLPLTAAGILDGVSCTIKCN